MRIFSHMRIGRPIRVWDGPYTYGYRYGYGLSHTHTGSPYAYGHPIRVWAGIYIRVATV